MKFQVDAPEGKPKEPFFLLTHGAAGDLSTSGLKAMSSALAQRGHLSVRANLPYRTAGRKSPPLAEKSVPGLIEIFEKVRSEVGPGARWVAGGASYGGRVASLAAAEGMESSGLIFFPYPLHRPGDSANPRTDHWSRILVPCLFIQGTNDPFCHVDMLQMALSTLGADPTLLLVQGGDHSLKVAGNKRSSEPGKSVQTVIEDLVPQVSDWVDSL